MKTVWEKVKSVFAWIGAGLLAVLALAGTALLVRRRPQKTEDPLINSFESGKKLAEAQQEAEGLQRDIAIQKAKNAAKDKANALKKDPAALADALNRVSDKRRGS
jgi:hypothetical protein